MKRDLTRYLVLLVAGAFLLTNILVDDMPEWVWIAGFTAFAAASALAAAAEGSLRSSRAWIAGLLLLAVSPLLPGALEWIVLALGFLTALLGSAVMREAGEPASRPAT